MFADRFTNSNIVIRKRFIGHLSRCSLGIGKISVSCNFGSKLRSIGLNFSKLNHGKGGLFLYPKIRKEFSENSLSSPIRCLETEKRSSLLTGWFFFIIPSPESLRNEFYGRFIHHPYLNSSMVGGIESALAFIAFSLFNSDVSFPINYSSNISQVVGSHISSSRVVLVIITIKGGDVKWELFGGTRAAYHLEISRFTAVLQVPLIDWGLGAGTVKVVAQKYNRRAVIMELNPEYIKMSQDRLRETDVAML